MAADRGRWRVAATVTALVLATASCGAFDSSTEDASTTTPAATITVTETNTPQPAPTASTPAVPSTPVDSSTSSESSPPSEPIPSAPREWSEVYAEVKSGVVRLDVLDCEGGGGTGTGFLISPTLVGTVAHVVDGYRTVRVTSPWTGVVTAGRVVGYSHDRDLALVETAGELPGHVFDLAEDVPEVGTEIAVLGFPLARSMQITTGDINDTHERRVVGNEFELSDMLLTDAAINPGNSGGPWIDRHGMVVALAESGPPYDPGFDDRAQGNNAGVSVRDAAAHFAEWESAQQPLEPCGPAPTPVEEALTTLDIYFSLINESDYESAYAQLDSANHPLAEMDSFVEDVKSTQDHSVGGDPNSWPLFEVLDAYVRGDNVEAEIRFESHQLSEQGPEGQTCTIWHLRYVFSEGNGVQSIHSSSAVDGQPEYEAC